MSIKSKETRLVPSYPLGAFEARKGQYHCFVAHVRLFFDRGLESDYLQKLTAFIPGRCRRGEIAARRESAKQYDTTALAKVQILNPPKAEQVARRGCVLISSAFARAASAMIAQCDWHLIPFDYC